MTPAPILLVGCYELGRPPLALAWPRAFLREAGFATSVVDLAVERFPDELARAARLVVIAVPMHTALRIGMEAAARVRRLNPSAHVCFHGLYAALNAEHLLAGPADSVTAGESEAALVELARAVLAGDRAPRVAGIHTRHAAEAPVIEKLRFVVPDRSGQAPLASYASYVGADGRTVPAASVEASRGCLHVCRHCPVVPVYGGRFFAVPVDVVLADVAQQVAAGAGHVTFGDPDFLNGPTHARRVAAALHAAFPAVTFDFTTKVEHLLRHHALLPELVAHGATLVTTAVESLSGEVLRRLEKGHTAADADRALDVARAAGLTVMPTFVPFTPWTTLEDVHELVRWISRRGLEPVVPPVQMGIRLLVPPGSRLLEDAGDWVGPLDPAELSHHWVHDDPRVDALQRELAELATVAAENGEAAATTWVSIRDRVAAALGHSVADEPMPPLFVPDPPRLTEHWFC